MKLTTSLVLFAFLGATIDANAGTVVSLTGPDGGGELVSTDRFVSFRWVSADPHFNVSVFAKLAAVSTTTPFEGIAYITSGPCCLPGGSSEFAHSEFTITSENSSFIELFQGLTLPPSNYFLTLAGTGSGAGLWVSAAPVAFLQTAPDSGLAGGDAVAQGPNINPVFPPGSLFISNDQQTQFVITDLGTPVAVVAESSAAIPLAGLMIFLVVRTFLIGKAGLTNARLIPRLCNPRNG